MSVRDLVQGDVVRSSRAAIQWPPSLLRSARSYSPRRAPGTRQRSPGVRCSGRPSPVRYSMTVHWTLRTRSRCSGSTSIWCAKPSPPTGFLFSMSRTGGNRCALSSVERYLPIPSRGRTTFANFTMVPGLGRRKHEDGQLDRVGRGRFPTADPPASLKAGSLRTSRISSSAHEKDRFEIACGTGLGRGRLLDWSHAPPDALRGAGSHCEAVPAAAPAADHPGSHLFHRDRRPLRRRCDRARAAEQPRTSRLNEFSWQ